MANIEIITAFLSLEIDHVIRFDNCDGSSAQNALVFLILCLISPQNMEDIYEFPNNSWRKHN